MINEILEKYRQLNVVVAAWVEGDKPNEEGFVEKVAEVVDEFSELLKTAKKSEEKEEEKEEEKDEE